jgi:ABC-type sugar transport system permease subunit
MTGGGPVNKTLSPIMFLYNSFRSLDKTMGYTIAGALLMMIAITVVNSIVFTVIRSQKSMDA